ncbi:MAG: BolA family protein [Nanoarchaeota archaeon]
MTIEEIKEKIEKSIPNSDAEIINERNDGMHFKAIVKSSSFKGKGLLEQHRMVLDTVAEELKRNLHSLSIETHEE